jgi:histidine triad (HIT) family protein
VDSCIFCLIGEKKIPSQVVYENEDVLAFNDLNPQAPLHVLVIPKLHIASLDSATETNATLLGNLLVACATVARNSGIDRSGYRVVTNTGNDGGQSVAHLHFHVLGNRQMSWPPG